MLTNAQPLTILSYPNWDHYIPFTQKITVVKTIDDLVEKIVDGKVVKEKVHTTMAHELWHAIDYRLKNKLFDRSFLFDRKLDMNPASKSRWNSYWKSDAEVTARVIEQYVAMAKWQDGIAEQPAMWKKDIFEKKIKPIVENMMKDKLWDYLIDKTN